jgi:16S rRNA (cytosine967-C5)-methyltransferase
MTSASIAANQQRTFLRLWECLQPRLGSDRNFPSRIQEALRCREFGARDRRLYRELLYTAVRYRPWVEELTARSAEDAVRSVAWLAADLPSIRGFREALLAGWPPVPESISARARHLDVRGELLPDWFRDHCAAAFVPPNLEALQRRAPLWIRLHPRAGESALDEFLQHGWHMRTPEVQLSARNVLSEVDLTSTKAFREGRFEIQDLGSQLILASAAVAPGGCWLDACAGAGGKALQLAGLLGPEGRVDAFDVRSSALAELRQRAQRGGFPNIHLLPRAPVEGNYDGVLVDAPCSGSGTWRRAPHLKWCTAPADITAHATLQQDLLARYGRLVRPGGLLIYATCSLSRRENQEVIAAFHAAHSGFSAVPPVQAFGCPADTQGLTILPANHDTDGFFVSTMRRIR